MDNKNIKIVSFNCRGFKTSAVEIHELCCDFDVVLLQEIWLPVQELNVLSCFHDDYLGFGISPMNYEDGPCIGRPHGGTAILWNKSLSAERLYNVDHSVIGLKIKLKDSFCM